MGIAPALQIRRMLRERSCRDVSVGYFAILLVGFVLWIACGAAARLPALVIPILSPCWSGPSSSSLPCACGGRPPGNRRAMLILVATGGR
jgi:hypothetical protein